MVDIKQNLLYESRFSPSKALAFCAEIGKLKTSPSSKAICLVCVPPEKDFMEGNNRPITEVIPLDDLFWDDECKKYKVVSHEECDNLLRACLNSGLDDKESFCLLRQFENYKVSGLLFKSFLEGGTVIKSFNERGEAVFEKRTSDDYNYIDLTLTKEANAYNEDFCVNTPDGVLTSSCPISVIPFDKVFSTIVSWCLKRGFNLIGGENPDDFETWRDEPSEEVYKEIKTKTWRIVKMEAGETFRIRVELGSWFEVDENT